MRRLREIAARSACVGPGPPAGALAPLLALGDAHVGEGDTLSLEALACGKPSILFEQEGLPPVYPEYAATGAMPAVRSPDELAALLGGGAPPIDPSARARLLDEHLRAETPAADALVSLARAHGARPEPAP